MITLYSFKRVRDFVVGETRDLRALWALEEAGLEYRVHGLDYLQGDTQTEDFRRISPFCQVPVLDDDGFILSETGAILLYVAEKAGKLMPKSLQGRARVTQWCCAALSNLEPTLAQVSGAPQHQENVNRAKGKFAVLERELDGHPYIAGNEFTVADILMTSVLRQVRKTHFLGEFSKLSDYFNRCQARSAWQRTLSAYEKRLGAQPGTAN